MEQRKQQVRKILVIIFNLGRHFFATA